MLLTLPLLPQIWSSTEQVFVKFGGNAEDDDNDDDADDHDDNGDNGNDDDEHKEGGIDMDDDYPGSNKDSVCTRSVMPSFTATLRS